MYDLTINIDNNPIEGLFAEFFSATFKLNLLKHHL